MRYGYLLLWFFVSIHFVISAFVFNMRSVEVTQSRAVLSVTNETSPVSSKKQSRNALLDELASRRARDMSERNYYAHETPDGEYFFNMFETLGIQSDVASCENLLLMPSGLSREEVNTEWIKSPAHKQCLDANHDSYGYAEVVFDNELQVSVYVYIGADLL